MLAEARNAELKAQAEYNKQLDAVHNQLKIEKEQERQ